MNRSATSNQESDRLGKPIASLIIPVFNNAQSLIVTVKAFIEASIPSHQLEIVVVDDGSSSAQANIMRESLDHAVNLLTLPLNQGRAAARNAGAQAATGRYLFFTDSDCQPRDSVFFSAHLALLTSGAIASSGPVYGNGSDFWCRYQTEASRMRRRLFSEGITYVGSTANLAVDRQAFLQAGGFDGSYTGYGFEDRDILIRLSKLGHIAWSDEAIIEHHDSLNLPDIARKALDAGANSSDIFRRTHPNPYVLLGYARLDTRYSKMTLILALLLRPFAGIVVKTGSVIIDTLAAPYFLKKWAVKTTQALHYAIGTLLAKNKNEPI